MIMTYINLCPSCKNELTLKTIYEEDDCGIEFARVKTYFVGIEEICKCGYKKFISEEEIYNASYFKTEKRRYA